MYFSEPDSAKFRTIFRAGGQILQTSVITRSEILSVLTKKESQRELAVGGAAAVCSCFKPDLEDGLVVLCPLSEEVHRQAERLSDILVGRKPPMLLGSLDLIHLASAFAMRSPAIVATDLRLRTVAVASGMPVIPSAQE